MAHFCTNPCTTPYIQDQEIASELLQYTFKRVWEYLRKDENKLPSQLRQFIYRIALINANDYLTMNRSIKIENVDAATYQVNIVDQFTLLSFRIEEEPLKPQNLVLNNNKLGN